RERRAVRALAAAPGSGSRGPIPECRARRSAPVRWRDLRRCRRARLVAGPPCAARDRWWGGVLAPRSPLRLERGHQLLGRRAVEVREAGELLPGEERLRPVDGDAVTG